ncbi:hypothetical protein E2C01_057503 [Portunus trituberculatus]|uniref:Uncharacterized protein n=1 Tax=Portunus trituberculatus TaxID=210409 RepID=A0A5B7H3I4_PORTR|nr:hypothetical protein [Portunus trituberculatus]
MSSHLLLVAILYHHRHRLRCRYHHHALRSVGPQATRRPSTYLRIDDSHRAASTSYLLWWVKAPLRSLTEGLAVPGPNSSKPSVLSPASRRPPQQGDVQSPYHAVPPQVYLHVVAQDAAAWPASRPSGGPSSTSNCAPCVPQPSHVRQADTLAPRRTSRSIPATVKVSGTAHWRASLGVAVAWRQ